MVYGEEPEGPGVFSDDTGKIVLFGDSSNATTTAGNQAKPTAELSVSDWEEFTAFKRWLRARQTKDESYQEFLLWRQFETFKARQDTQ